MENQDFRISFKIVWMLVILNLVLTTVGILDKLQHQEFSQNLLTAGVAIFFSTWIIIMGDIIKNKIYNKTFWIIAMLITPSITSIFYLIQRNKLLKLGYKFS